MNNDKGHQEDCLPVEVEVRQLLQLLAETTLSCIGTNPVSVLARLPRSGKAIRIDRFGLSLPKRSVLDHIVSLGYNADVFLRTTRRQLDRRVLSQCIVFHDLNETIGYDIPFFTSPSLAGELYRTDEEKHRIEAEADRILAQDMPPPLADMFRRTISLLNQENSDVYRFFRMLDATDPIIAIWRYIDQFREALQPNQFLEAMNDFFANPHVLPTCTDSNIAEFIQFLQDKHHAKIYFANPSYLSQFRNADEGFVYVLRTLVEHRPIQFTH